MNKKVETEKLRELEIKTGAIYLYIVGSYFFLNSIHKQKQSLLSNTPLNEKEVHNLNIAGSYSILIADVVFLYYSLKELEEQLAKRPKRQDNKLLRRKYNLLYADLLDFLGSLYTVFNTHEGADPL